MDIGQEHGLAERLVRRAFAADAARDVEAFLDLLTPDVRFRLGAQPEVRGHAAVRGVVSALFAAMRAIRHELIALWVDGDAIALRAEVEMTSLAGASVRLPYMNALRVAPDGRLAEYFIHIDLGPALAAAHPASGE